MALIVLIFCLVADILQRLKIQVINYSVFEGNIVTYLSFVVSILLAFSWILWQLIRPYNSLFFFGFSYNGLLISISLALLAGVLNIYEGDGSNDKGGYVSIDEKSEDISYGEIPEGDFDLRKLILFTSWQSPITVRLLYYLAMILSLCYLITSMVNLSDSQLVPGFFSTLFREIIYSLIFIGTVRVLGELAMKIFVKYHISNAPKGDNNKILIIEEKMEPNQEEENNYNPNTQEEYNNQDLLKTEEESQNNNFDDDQQNNNVQYQQLN